MIHPRTSRVWGVNTAIIRHALAFRIRVAPSRIRVVPSRIRAVPSRIRVVPSRIRVVPSSGEVAGGAGGAIAPPAGLKKGVPK